MSSLCFKPDKNPKFVSCPLGDVVDVGSPAEVAGECDTQEPGLVDDFKGVRARKVELRKEVKLF